MPDFGGGYQTDRSAGGTGYGSSGTGGPGNVSASAGLGGDHSVWGYNPSTGVLEQWGTRSLLGGTMTTAAGYRAGGLDAGGSYRGLYDHSHPGYTAYRQAHTNARNAASISAAETATEVMSNLDNYLSMHVNNGTMTVDEAGKIRDDVSNQNYASLPSHVKSNVDIDALQTAIEGTGSYDTGFNDLLSVGLSKLGLGTLQTPESVKEKARKEGTASERTIGELANTYAAPLAVEAASHVVTPVVTNDAMTQAISRALGDIVASSVTGPATSAKTIGELIDAANTYQAEIALGLTPARDWSTLSQMSPYESGSTLALLSSPSSIMGSTPAAESYSDRMQRWAYLQNLKNAASQDTSGLSFLL